MGVERRAGEREEVERKGWGLNEREVERREVGVERRAGERKEVERRGLNARIEHKRSGT